MRFVVLMAARELRASWRRLVFFFLCIAVGVAAIVALRSVIQSVRAGIAGQARSLLAADLLMTSNNAFGEKVRSLVASEIRAGRIEAVSEAIELPTMVRPATASATVTRMEIGRAHV